MVIFNSLFFQKGGDDAELLLKRSISDMEEGIELRDEYGSQPTWMDKLEEAQYTMSKYVNNVTHKYIKSGFLTAAQISFSLSKKVLVSEKSVQKSGMFP